MLISNLQRSKEKFVEAGLITSNALLLLGYCLAWIKLSDENALDESHRVPLGPDWSPEQEAILYLDELPAAVDGTQAEGVFSGLRRILGDIPPALIASEVTSLWVIVRTAGIAKVIEAILDLRAHLLEPDSVQCMPLELAELMGATLDQSGSGVCVPWDASITLTWAAIDAGLQLEGCMAGPGVVAWLKVVAVCGGVDTRIFNSPVDSNMSLWMQLKGREFESCMYAAPFGLRYDAKPYEDLIPTKRSEKLESQYVHLYILLSRVKSRLTIVLTESFMQKQSGREAELKEQIIENNWLEAFIKLPAGILPQVSVPLYLMVIDKTRIAGAVIVMDASRSQYFSANRKLEDRLPGVKRLQRHGEILEAARGGAMPYGNGAKVSIEAIADQNYALSAERYIKTPLQLRVEKYLEAVDTAPLESLVDIVRSQPLKTEDEGRDPYLEITPNDIQEDGGLSEPTKQLMLWSSSRQAQRQRLEDGDVLLVTRGAVGRAAIVSSLRSSNWIAGQVFNILRVRPEAPISPRALYMYLTSQTGETLLAKYIKGAAMKSISAKDLQSIPVPISADELENLDQKYAELQQACREIAAQKEHIKQQKLVPSVVKTNV